MVSHLVNCINFLLWAFFFITGILTIENAPQHSGAEPKKGFVFWKRACALLFVLAMAVTGWRITK